MVPNRKFAELSKPEHCYNTRSKGRLQWKCPPGYGYRKREDGLLDMTWTPPYQPLQNNTSHNTTQSALLRLPGEIRNLIFQFALGGYVINIDQSPTVYLPDQLSITRQWGQTATHRGRDQIYPELVPGAPAVAWWPDRIFKLPQTCRQVYAETATAVYRYNTFSAGASETMRWLTFVANRLPAQINAMTSIRPPMRAHPGLVDGPWRNEWGCVVDTDQVPASLEVRFPGLKRVVVVDGRDEVAEQTLDRYKGLGIEIVRADRSGTTGRWWVN